MSLFYDEFEALTSSPAVIVGFIKFMKIMMNGHFGEIT